MKYVVFLLFIFRDVENFEKKKYNILGKLYIVLGGTRWNIIQLIKKGNLWLVPEDAIKPEDQRRKKEQRNE